MNPLTAFKKIYRKLEGSPQLVPMDGDIIIPDGVTDCKKYKITPVDLWPGDIFKCTVRDKKYGGEQVVQEKFTKRCKIDTIITFKSNDTFGLKTGIGAIFGEDK